MVRAACAGSQVRAINILFCINARGCSRLTRALKYSAPPPLLHHALRRDSHHSHAARVGCWNAALAGDTHLRGFLAEILPVHLTQYIIPAVHLLPSQISRTSSVTLHCAPPLRTHCLAATLPRLARAPSAHASSFCAVPQSSPCAASNAAIGSRVRAASLYTHAPLLCALLTRLCSLTRARCRPPLHRACA